MKIDIMAFKEKTAKGYTVKQGNTGEVLKRFTGKGAEKKANEYIDELHRKNKPKAKNKGTAAKKRYQKRVKAKRKTTAVKKRRKRA